MNSYLQNRNGNYHFRIRVPSDLSGVISSVELVKSLKTKNKKEARLVALPYVNRRGILTQHRRPSLTLPVGNQS